MKKIHLYTMIVLLNLSLLLNIPINLHLPSPEAVCTLELIIHHLLIISPLANVMRSMVDLYCRLLNYSIAISLVPPQVHGVYCQRSYLSSNSPINDPPSLRNT